MFYFMFQKMVNNNSRNFVTSLRKTNFEANQQDFGIL